MMAERKELVAGGYRASHFDGFGEAAAHWPQDKGRNLAFGSQRYAGSLPWEFSAAVELQPRVFEKFSRKTHVFGAVHTPEPQLFFLALQEIQTLFELLHGAVKRPRKKKHAKVPGVAGVVHL